MHVCHHRRRPPPPPTSTRLTPGSAPTIGRITRCHLRRHLRSLHLRHRHLLRRHRLCRRYRHRRRRRCTRAGPSSPTNRVADAVAEVVRVSSGAPSAARPSTTRVLWPNTSSSTATNASTPARDATSPSSGRTTCEYHHHHHHHHHRHHHRRRRRRRHHCN